MRVKFYLTSSGRSPIEDFLIEQSFDLKSDFADAVFLLECGETLKNPLSKNLSSIYSGLHELRLKDHASIYRFFYFIKKADGIYFIHAYKKKTQKLPKKEIDLVLKRLREI